MKIGICGSTGYIGENLKTYLEENGHKVFRITRAHLQEENRFLLMDLLTEVDTVINLAGVSVRKPWTPAYRREIFESRVETTRKLVEAINQSPTVDTFISTSAIGHYDLQQKPLTEDHHCAGADFLAMVCQRWEEQASKLSTDKRLVIVRLGIVFDSSGGALPVMLKSLAQKFLVCVGKGDNYISWISLKDVIHAFEWIAERPYIKGVYNLTSPGAIRQKELLTRIQDRLKHVPIFHIPEWILRLIIGKRACFVLDSHQIYPERLMLKGFVFEHPSFEHFLSDPECMINFNKHLL